MVQKSNRWLHGRVFFTILATGIVLLATRPAMAEDAVPFTANFRGAFQIVFGAGPGGTDDLRFSGNGIANHLGRSSVDGHSTTQPSETDPLRSDIVTDRVILTAADGDELWLENAGQDNLDFSIPGRIFIRGSGTMAVVGGTWRFRGATGSGTWAVVAEVASFVPGGITGTFAIRFEGRIAPPSE